MERHQQDLNKCSRMLYAIPDNLDYHIKAAKTYFHHNMHVQSKAWLQVMRCQLFFVAVHCCCFFENLNEADPVKNDGHSKGKKKAARKSIR